MAIPVIVVVLVSKRSGRGKARSELSCSGLGWRKRGLSSLAMGLPGSPSNASNCAVSVFEISDDESESDTSLTSLTQLLEEWMDEEMASIEKEQKEQAEQVNGGSPGDLRSGETSQGQGPPGPGEVSKEEAPAKSDGEDLASLPWEILWRKLEAQGWRMEHGPRGKGRQARTVDAPPPTTCPPASSVVQARRTVLTTSTPRSSCCSCSLAMKAARCLAKLQECPRSESRHQAECPVPGRFGSGIDLSPDLQSPRAWA
eukprot:s6400_g2.t1